MVGKKIIFEKCDHSLLRPIGHIAITDFRKNYPDPFYKSHREREHMISLYAKRPHYFSSFRKMCNHISATMIMSYSRTLTFVLIVPKALVVIQQYKFPECDGFNGIVVT